MQAKKEKLIERKKLQPLVLSRDPAENAKYAESEEEKGIGGNHVSDTRDPEAWPVAFCLARIDVEGGDDGKRMKRDKRNRREE